MTEKNKHNSWGNYPKYADSACKFISVRDRKTIRQKITTSSNIIAQGNARSYGDSAFSETVLLNTHNNYFLDFDEKTGVLHCESGVLIDDIIATFLHRGWFPAITPGTKFVSIGGAIAADVHGKNHHHAGTFSSCVLEFDLMLASGEIITCSRTENQQMFHASCGGMGLTGFILSAKIRLLPVRSQYINQLTVKTRNLQETFEQFEKHRDSTYSVAWIDCQARGAHIGRSVITFGEHASDGDLNYQKSARHMTLPFYLPHFSVNSLSLKVINTFLYQRVIKHESHQKVSFDSFFYPLDALHHWNRLYGNAGFLQYQCVFPLEKSYEGMHCILSEIAKSRSGSFLAVLKLFGEENANYLSFPMKGYTLAVDFKNEPATFALFEKLDKLVCQFGGRFYLAKDAHISREVFEKNYPRIDVFRNFRESHNMTGTFSSFQSKRLGL